MRAQTTDHGLKLFSTGTERMTGSEHVADRMSILTHANLWYGQLRGYDRVGIAARVNSALRRSPEEIRRQQLADFREIVASSVERFPFYADRLRERMGSVPDVRDEFVPSDLPLWTKDDQRAFFAGLRPADFRSCFLHSSGGSTGVPTQFYMTRKSYEWRTEVARRSYSFASAEPGRRAFFVWGDAAIQPPLHVRLKTRLSQWVENRRYFNCFFFDQQRKRFCCQAINQRRPKALVGYAGNLAELAAFCREQPELLKWRTPNIITAAEGLQPGQRELIEEVLGGRVFMSYGSREFMSIGMECLQDSGYYLADDNLLVEVVDERGNPVAAGQAGQIVVTDLHNAANPFIRYLVGDIGVMAPEDNTCPDGLPFRRLLEVRGRSQEFVHTPDGEHLTLLYFSHNLKEFPWVEGYQVVQRTLQHLIIKVRSGRLISTEMKRELETQLRSKLGTTRIDVEQVDELTRRPNGKVAALVSELEATSCSIGPSSLECA